MKIIIIIILKLYICVKGANRQQRYGPYRLQAGSSAMAPIVSRQAAALWPLSSLGRQQSYGPIVYRQATVVQGLIVSQR